jgi:hypothetical protein
LEIRREVAMEICVNKKSETFFIYLKDVGRDKRLLIAPDGKIAPLRVHFFYEPEEFEESTLRDKGLVSEKQVASYRFCMKNREEDPLEKIMLIIGGLSYSQREILKYLLKHPVEKILNRQSPQNR